VNLALAFIRRDWLRLASYRLQIVWRMLGMLAFVVSIYFLGKVIGHVTNFPGSGPGYASFLLGGIAFTDIFMTSMQTFPGAIRDAQLTGTLEPMLLAPIRTAQLVWASSLFPILQSLLRVALVVVVATLGFGYWTHANPLTALIVVVPGCLVFAGLGLLAASFVLAFKQGDPVVAGFAFISSLVGGTLFPVASLPSWVQSLASLLPLTHGLNGVRLALQGAGPGAVAGDAAVLWAMAIAVLLVAGFSFELALRHAKREGSLVQY
jgi:ABC-2 type transport system permease protein